MKLAIAICVALSVVLTAAALQAAPASQPAASQPTDTSLVDTLKDVSVNFKSGKYGIAIGFLLLFLTELAKRIVRMFSLEIPHRWLPWIAAVMGVGGTVGVSLSAGSNWFEAVMAGIMVGATAGGLWSMVGRYFAKENTPKVDVSGVINKSIILCLALMILPGCGTTLAQKINMVNEATASARKIVGPQISAACLVKANECKAAGVEVSEACKPLVACRTVRDAFYAAVEGVHVAVLAFRIAEAVGKPAADLQGALIAAKAALEKAWDLAIKSGYVSPTGGGAVIGPK